ncbi:uncharacterized protein LOC129704262 isoform X1 [Leucoraja erinacea]|uniref:uncharacterized protein LOC129704262 isoform X1 n=2 Tax=Leucoraja erinaceus TaxID=7782 RepID=UPI002456186D|nr:uncharacterized protein LOC129704262 isoform X1 [Leucoraja erinacea]
MELHGRVHTEVCGLILGDSPTAWSRRPLSSRDRDTARMRPSDCKAVGLLWLWLLAGLSTVALCRAGTTTITVTITTLCKMVPLPLRNDRQEWVVMRRLDPNIEILRWKSSSPERLHIVNSSYKDRIMYQQAFIELRDVGPSDEGTYKITYYGSDLIDLFELRVVEPMSTPAVGDSCNSSLITLNCFIDDGCTVTYQWERRSQDPGVGNATFPRHILRLLNTGQHNYTCIGEDCCSSHAVTANLLCDSLLRRSRSRGMIAAPVVGLIPVALILVLSLYLW